MQFCSQGLPGLTSVSRSVYPEHPRTPLGKMRTIKPIRNGKSIQLKWAYQGHRYTLHPLPSGQYDNPGDLERVRDIATQIALDIRGDRFDPSLERYRPKAIAAPVKPGKLIDLWDQWVDTLDIPEETKASGYQDVRRMIGRFRPEPKATDATWFTKVSQGYAASTYNARLRCLSRCLGWAVDQGLAASDPYKALSTKVVQRAKVKPFSLSEIQSILGYMEKKHPRHRAFLSFLFMTGCRTSEATGIQWKRVDFERGEITIADATPISMATGRPYRKGTKKGRTTVLDMTDALRVLLDHQVPGKPDALVFPAPKGGIINTRNFRSEIWKPCLDSLGIAYRKPYTTRHTMASHALDQGLSLPQVAYLLGHSDLTQVQKTYGHMVHRPSLPDML